jgi:hypothetical protein
MSGSKAATEFLSGFGGSDGKSSSGSDPLDKLGQTLARAGPAGMEVAEAMQVSGLSREQFYAALSVATKLNLIESFQDQGANKLRLTPSAMSLY